MSRRGLSAPVARQAAASLSSVIRPRLKDLGISTPTTELVVVHVGDGSVRTGKLQMR